MIEVVDLKEIRSGCTDLAELRTYLRQLTGQPFRFFRVGYGEELRLHLGELRESSSPKMRGRTRGSYIIGARASSWVVFSSPTSTLLASDDAEGHDSHGAAGHVEIQRIEDGGYITPGATVVGVTSDRSRRGFTLQLSFSDGSTVFVGPAAESHESVPDGEDATGAVADVDVSDWEILTPHSRILKAGDGRWSSIDSANRKGDPPAP